MVVDINLAEHQIFPAVAQVPRREKLKIIFLDYFIIIK